MRVEPVLPIPQLGDPLIAILVLLVIVRPRRIVDVIPILRYVLLFPVLLTLLASTSLTLLSTIESIDVVIIGCSPVRKRAFGL